MEEKEVINVALASDAGYAIGLSTAAASIAYYASKDVTLSFYFLDGGIPDVVYSRMEKAFKSIHPSVRYRRILVDQSRFADFPPWRGNKMAYARFLLVDELKDIDHLIYCDVDFLWRNDISELWRLRDDAIVLQGVADPFVRNTPEPRWFMEHGYSFPRGRYLNSGLLLMNLKKLREENFVNRAFELIKMHPDFLFADQETFVILLEKQTRFLEEKWMRFTSTLTSKDFSRPLVCHYVNDVPWKAAPFHSKLRDATMAWYFMARRIGVRMPVTLIVFYVLTRTPVVRNVFYLILRVIGGRRAEIYFREKCSSDVR